MVKPHIKTKRKRTADGELVSVRTERVVPTGDRARQRPYRKG